MSTSDFQKRKKKHTKFIYTTTFCSMFGVSSAENEILMTHIPDTFFLIYALYE